MKKIQIAVTFWYRFPDRLRCLNIAYDSLEKFMFFGDYEHEWIISSETDHCLDKSEIIRLFDSRDKVKLIWNNGPASLSSNLNNVLKACDAPLLFYLQDDWRMTRETNIGTVADFLLSSEYDLVRYRYALSDPSQLTRVNKELDLYEIKHTATNLYSDQPHLKKLNFHHKYGYFPESSFRGFDSGDCETKFNNALKKSDSKILFKKDTAKLFTHISNVSTLKEKWDNWHKRNRRPLGS